MGMTVGKGKKEHQVPWRGAAGLADDVRYYGRWMREKVFERKGHLYPKAMLPDGEEATVIAWLWARTVPCPNPACGIAMPLMKTFQLSKKRDNEHWTKPVVDREAGSVSFVVQDHDDGVPSVGTVNRNGAICVACDNTTPLSYVREQSTAGKMGEQMTAIVAEGDRKRLFLSPTDEHVRTALSAEPEWRPSGKMSDWSRDFSDLIPKVHALLLERDASAQYASAVCTYLALAVGKSADYCCSFASWHISRHIIRNLFARQAIPMVWDFAESNPFSKSTGNWLAHINWITKAIDRTPINVNSSIARHTNASTTTIADDGPVIATDPPY